MHIRQNHGTYPPDGWHLLTFLQVLVRLNLGLHLFVQRCALLVHFGLDTAGVRNRVFNETVASPVANNFN